MLDTFILSSSEVSEPPKQSEEEGALSAPRKLGDN